MDVIDTPPWLRPVRGRFPGVPAWGVSTTSAPLEEFGISPIPGITRDWALAGADGTGVRVCVVDTGVDEDHPRVGRLERSAGVVIQPDGSLAVEEGVHGDSVGHGTACASIIRSVAPAVSLSSVRVLTRGTHGSGKALLSGLEWAIQQSFHVVNMSLATSNPELEPALRRLADQAYFRRVILVVSAQNIPVLSFPWTFSSVISVASHDEDDPMTYYYNGGPPVDFYARGVRVRVAWVGGTDKVSTGNSMAAPHLAGVCALILGKRPWLTPFQLKTVLFMTATNIDARC
jgi:subtilisin